MPYPAFRALPLWETVFIWVRARSPTASALLTPGSKSTQDLLSILLQPLGDRGLSYPMQIVDGPLQLVEGEFGGLSVSLGFLRTVPNAFLARVHWLLPPWSRVSATWSARAGAS
jgi:hypothetical protein